MKVITFLNEKGGVGKTTLSTTVAAGLADRGANVLVVDADPQGHSTLTLGLENEPGLYELVIRNAAWTDWMKPVKEIPRLYVLPGNIETRGIPLHLEDVFALDNRLRQLRGRIDYVVIDTPPTPSLFHSSIYMATDYILVPTKAAFLGFDGLQKSMAHAKKYNQQRQMNDLGDLNFMGIVINMFEGRTLEHRENFDDLKQQCGDLVWDPIPSRIIWEEATRARMPVFRYAPGTDAANDALHLVDQVEGAMV